MQDHPFRRLYVGASLAVNAQIRPACPIGTAMPIACTIEEPLVLAEKIPAMRDEQIVARHAVGAAGSLSIKEIVPKMVSPAETRFHWQGRP